MTTSALPSSRVWLVTFLFAAISFSTTAPVRAAQEIFWPFNSFPAPAWSLSYTDASSFITASVPGVGTILTRNPVFTNLNTPITLPALSNSAIYSASATFTVESSLDAGANWAPYLGNGVMSLTLRHTNDSAGALRFEVEMSTQSIPVDGAYGAALVRESPTVASLGELVVTATNGGLFYRGFVNFYLEVSVDDGTTWVAFSPTAYVELSGPSGVPAVLSISKSDATVAIQWRTGAFGHYQLQKTGALGGTSWVNVGSPIAGDGSDVRVVDTFDTQANQFYRVQLLP